MSNEDEQNELLALTHLDGRNGRKLVSLRAIFSEYAWMKARLLVMTQYLLFIYPLLKNKQITATEEQKLLNLHKTFSTKDGFEVRRIEARVNHDLKALEMFFVQSLKRNHFEEFIPYVDLGIGSEDINNIAYAQGLTESLQILKAEIKIVCGHILKIANEHANTHMVARTHAQSANITTLGKEFTNTLNRLCDEYENLLTINIAVKCSGEVGTYQALNTLDQKIDWMQKTDDFIASLGLRSTHNATQIAPYDSYSRIFQSISRLNTILTDFVQNLWLYILIGYVRVLAVVKEVGSAGMPHKVNPIYLEGAEGNLKMANILLEGLSRELPINRLQRSFTDSTIRRNVVLPLSFTLLAYQSICEGLKRIVVEKGLIENDSRAHPEVFLESIKAYGLVHGISDMYDRLKAETRGKVLTTDGLSSLIQQLPLSDNQRKEITLFCKNYNNPYPVRIVTESVKRAKKLFGI